MAKPKTTHAERFALRAMFEQVYRCRLFPYVDSYSLFCTNVACYSMQLNFRLNK